MFSATEFFFDGRFSGEFGVKIARLDSENMRESVAIAYNITTEKSSRAERFNFQGIESTQMPQYQFSIFSGDGSTISDIVLRELQAWLLGGNGFRELRFLCPGYEQYSYNCIFSEATKQYHLNRLVGLNLSATFDSQYCLGKTTKKKILGHGDPIESIVMNNSDNSRGYVYPVITLDSTGAENEQVVRIINLSDDNVRAFEFKMYPNEIVKFDNELRSVIIDGVDTSAIGGDRLSDFNKKWLRLKQGANKLTVVIDGLVTIECPEYALIGF